MEDRNESPQSTPADWRFWRRAAPALVLLVAFLVFLIQNAEPIEVEFLTWSVTTRGAFVLVAAAAVGALTWELMRRVLRRRKG